MAIETLMHNTEPLGALLGDASDIIFDNSGTSLESTDVEGALKEIDSAIPNVVDNLTSTSSTDALSAKQGKVLNDKVNGLKTIKEDTKTYTTDQYGHFQFGSDFNYGKNVIQIFCLNRQSNRQAILYTWNSGVIVSLSDGGGTQIPNETNDYRVVYFT